MRGLRDRILRNFKSIPQVKYIDSSSFSPSRVLQEVCPNAPPPEDLPGREMAGGKENSRNANEEEEGSSRYRRPDLNSPSLFDPDLLAAFHLAVADFRRSFKPSSDCCPDFETLEKLSEGNLEEEEKSQAEKSMINPGTDVEEEERDETFEENVEALEEEDTRDEHMEEEEEKSREKNAGKSPEKDNEEFIEETLDEEVCRPGQTGETLKEKAEILEETTQEEYPPEEEEKSRGKKTRKSLDQDREDIVEGTLEEEGRKPTKTEETLMETAEILGDSNQEEHSEKQEEKSREKKSRKSLEQDGEEIAEETLEEEARRPIKMRRTREEGVVLYTTSLGGIRKTFEDCNKVRSLLCSLRVVFDERDLSMHMDYRHELHLRLGGVAAMPPCLFVDGTLVGGADNVLGLHERGELLPILRHAPFDSSGGALCQVCAGARFLLCGVCRGGRKVFCKDGRSIRRCSQCNENGLVVCVDCRSRAIRSTCHLLDGASCL